MRTAGACCFHASCTRWGRISNRQPPAPSLSFAWPNFFSLSALGFGTVPLTFWLWLSCYLCEINFQKQTRAKVSVVCCTPNPSFLPFRTASLLTLSSFHAPCIQFGLRFSSFWRFRSHRAPSLFSSLGRACCPSLPSFVVKVLSRVSDPSLTCSRVTVSTSSVLV